MHKIKTVLFFVILLFFVSHLSFAFSDSYYNTAIGYFNKAEYKKAIPFFKKAIENKENLCDAYFFLGLSYINLKKYKDAYYLSSALIDLCNKRLEENPKDFKAHYYLGYIYELRSFVPGVNEYDEAIRHLMAAHGISPRDLSVIEHIAFCYLQLKDYDKALEYINLGEQISPNNLWLLYHKGYSYMQLKKKEEAKAYFEKVLAYGKKGNPYYEKAKKMMRKMR